MRQLADGDLFYTRGGGFGWDCGDFDADIFPGAGGEAVGDGQDTNCNGDDDT